MTGSKTTNQEFVSRWRAKRARRSPPPRRVLFGERVLLLYKCGVGAQRVVDLLRAGLLLKGLDGVEGRAAGDRVVALRERGEPFAERGQRVGAAAGGQHIVEA